MDLVCAVTGFNRDYARRALKQALRPRVVKPRTPRPPTYDAKVVAALQKCWAVVNAPAGKRWPRSWPSWYRCCAAMASWTSTMTPRSC